MSNTVQELRTNKVLKVEGMTDRGRLRCREVKFSRTGRMMKKGKRFLHQADVKPLYKTDIKKMFDSMVACGIIEEV